MSNLNSLQNYAEGTDVQRFMAQRGAVIVKEMKDIGKIRGVYASSVKASTMIISVSKESEKDTRYAVKVERSTGGRGDGGSVLLDFDELDEVINACDFIMSSAVDLSSQQKEYTEVTYLTRDSALFGFYQNQQIQQSFVRVAPQDEIIPIETEKFRDLKQLLINAKEHLLSS
ncbi:hypothetical protein [Synechococcus elongatus]|uniref:hypothetical protein n=1 Tax=Synechococcus elongatus TaxID=32046 RepID=UPI000F7E1D2E|nr:hypothetical protein [Synechococcus elongatus]